MDKSRQIIRANTNNVIWNSVQFLLVLIPYFTLLIGPYQVCVNLLWFRETEFRIIRKLLIVYFICCLGLLVFVIGMFSDVFSIRIFLVWYIGILLALFSFILRIIDYRLVKKENIDKVAPYSEEEIIKLKTIDKKQLYYSHLLMLLIGFTYYLTPISVIYFCIMDSLLFYKTKYPSVRLHFLILCYVFCFLGVIGVGLSLIFKNEIFSVKNLFFAILPLMIYSVWIRYYEYRISKNTINTSN